MFKSSENILAVNGGSSSIKFAIYTNESEPVCILSGKIERIGLADPVMSFTENGMDHKGMHVSAATMQESATSLVDWLQKRNELSNLVAIGHRIVFGMEKTETQIITTVLTDHLKNIRSYDPDHIPGEIALINAFRQKLSHMIQVACFDTLFHSTMPRLATMLAIPRALDEQGIRKYGFHGLSYQYILEELRRAEEPAVVQGRIIIAHLGNGASLAAVKDGHSVDTSMGFTPAGGLMMGTRSGDMDPGTTAVILQKMSMSAIEFNDFINHDCGLLGVSQTSPDMQQLLKNENTDIRATEAVNLFCYNVKKWIGSFTAVLEGLDVLVFTGGIGENAAEVRWRICIGLSYLGIELDRKMNENGKGIVSGKNSRIKVYVIATNEELMIAKLVNSVL
ncbi:MAG TPA: acetate/propionate family kinase [Puia sp.]|nr:acetate/propionate family kinase [Puia sp.]